jgi:molybdopterin-guanine dinucleotide biosynthesis protein A
MAAIVVAGGVSKRFGQDKALVKLANKPLVSYVVDKAISVVDDVTVVVNSETQKKKIAEVINEKARIMVDQADVQTPLAGALTGFEAAPAKYAILLACDTPFLAPEILSLLLEVSANRSAAIPRWPNGNIEPLHASYHAPTAAKAAKTAIENGKFDMRAMVDNMRNVRYISTMVLRQLDPKLTTFFNINSPNDLRQAEAMVKHHVY